MCFESTAVRGKWFEVNWLLTLTLLSSYIICHQYRDMPVCTSVQSDKALYSGLFNLSFRLDIPKMIMDSSKKWKVLIGF